MGARVELSDDARYEGRNGIVARSGSEPIVPFTLRIVAGDTVIVRDSGVKDSPFEDLQPKALLRSSPAVVASATRVWNFGDVMTERTNKLANALQALEDDEHNATARAALKSRLANMRFTSVFAPALHDSRVVYSFALKAPPDVVDEARRLDPPLDTAADWPIEFWMGAWDIDAMTGYVDGWLMIPQRKKPTATPERTFPDVLGKVQPLEFAEAEEE